MLKYLALGDSYTIGEGVSEQERWPVRLVKELNQRGQNIADPQIIATTGWTTGELLAAISEAEPRSEYNLVSLLIGVNNQYRGLALDIFREDINALVQRAIYFARKKPEGVMVLSIPDYSVTPFAAQKEPQHIARELEVYNTLTESVCRRLGVAYYNITALSKKAAMDPGLLAEDALHPSGQMYAQWVDNIFPYVVKQLRLLEKV